jgi:murein DD-endopeptidase MepM/ murein hydrolase activator NlpD
VHRFREGTAVRRLLPALMVALAVGVAGPYGGPLFTVASACNPSLSACQQLNQAQGQLAADQTQLSAIQAHLDDALSQVKALAALITSLETQIQGQQLQIAQTQSQLEDLDRQIRYSQAAIQRREAQVQSSQQLLDQRVRAADKHDQLNYFELIVSSKTLPQLLDRLSIIQDVISGDQRIIAQIKAQRAEVEHLTSVLNGQRAEKADLLKQQQDQEAELQQQRQVQAQALAVQQQLEQQYEAQRQQLEQQSAQVQSQIPGLEALYQKQLAALTPPSPPKRPPSSGGAPAPAPRPPAGAQFVWPQASHLITQGFGCTDLPFEPYDPNCPSKHFHTGVDIAGPNGTPIWAAAAGVVTLYYDSTGYGLHALLLHPGGYQTLYGHMSGFAAGNGQIVAQGQVIGYEGSTGNSTGPHLHFEVRYNGSPVNPCAYVGC